MPWYLLQGIAACLFWKKKFSWHNITHSPNGLTIQLGIPIWIRIQIGIPTWVWYSTWNSNSNGDKFGRVHAMAMKLYFTMEIGDLLNSNLDLNPGLWNVCGILSCSNQKCKNAFCKPSMVKRKHYSVVTISLAGRYTTSVKRYDIFPCFCHKLTADYVY